MKKGMEVMLEHVLNIQYVSRHVSKYIIISIYIV